MGLFNKLFTKSHEPYELKGRWYKLTVSVDDDTGNLSIVKSDIPVFDEDAAAFGYNVEGNIIFVYKGYVIGCSFMALSGFIGTDSISLENYIDPDNGVMSSFAVSDAEGALFDLYLYVVKSNGTPNTGSDADPGDNG